jgi:hypothetical protein
MSLKDGNEKIHPELAPSPSESSVTNTSVLSHAWHFNNTRDANTYGLSIDQCNVAFPGLFDDIERAAGYRKRIGAYEPDDIDISWTQYGAVRAAILNQRVTSPASSLRSSLNSTQLFLTDCVVQLYIVDTRLSGSDHETPRILAILSALHRAIITSPSPLPNTEFSFSTSDIADPDHLKRTVWALSRTEDEEEKWLMSDFGFWSWPSNLIGGYEQVRQEITHTEPEFHMKKKQAIWRGALKTNKHREDLLRVTEKKEWADVKSIEWSSAPDPRVSDGSKPISMPEHCQYQFLIHTEGTSSLAKRIRTAFLIFHTLDSMIFSHQMTSHPLLPSA